LDPCTLEPFTLIHHAEVIEVEDLLLLLNGTVLTLDPANRKADALAVAKGRIGRIGTTEEIRRTYGPDVPAIDLRGKAVLPGFIDSHVHFMSTSFTVAGLDLASARTLEEVLERVRERTEETAQGEWILGYFLTHLSDRGMPTRRDLDRAAPHHPVRVTHRNGHLCSLNTRAMEILGPSPDLDGVEKEDGEPTGVVRDPAIQTLPHPGYLLNEEGRLRALELASRRALEKGVTTLHALDGGPRRPGAMAFLLAASPSLPVKVVLYNQSMDVQEALGFGLPRIGGCICADGAFESHTAALFEPYADEPGNYGTLSYSDGQMHGFILGSHRAGLQVAVHCEGDRAVEQVLSGYEKALRELPREDARHRIEHYEIPTENQIRRTAGAGIFVNMQPAFLPAFFFRDGVNRYETFLGKPRLRWIHPYRTMLDAGIVMAGGSDSPVTEVNPLAGIAAAVNHPHAEERLSVMEALRLFTANGARFAFEEREKGTIEPGKAADLVVLSEDPCSVAPERIGEIAVEMTFVNGKIACNREGC
jgi:predicted amidohydrolase YtcJ